MEKCGCIKVTFSKPSNKGNFSMSLCCGKCDAFTIPENVNKRKRSSDDKRPDFIEYCFKEDRLQTFKDWPKTLKQTPEQLSAAGFFYTQKGDRVICFCCGLGLCQWEEDDVPWEQHALHRGECEYLQLLKGLEYITSVKKKFAVDEPDLSTLFIEN